MLGLGRYLLGVLEILLLLGAAGTGGWSVRRWLLPDLGGAVAVLASGVVAAAILIWCAEILGSFSALEPVPYLLLVLAVGAGCRLGVARLALGGRPRPAGQVGLRATSRSAGGRGGEGAVATAVALLVALIAVIRFAGGVKTRLSTGMTGFDSTWYHGPFAAGFFQSGDTWRLHFIAPQFLAWFYPANGEIFHAIGMLAFGRDLLSPLLNLGWFVGCLLACWCIGRPYRVGAWSLVLGAVALSVPALADQAGEARNDLIGIFFLLAGVAIALNVWGIGGAGGRPPAPDAAGVDAGGLPPGGVARLGPALFVGLTAGLAGGTKLNYLLPAAVLVLGVVFISPRGWRARAFAAALPAALAGGGYWYLRNLAHAGNPLPWVHHLGPISLPSPGQSLGGREAHSVLGYLTDGGVWSEWFLPDLHSAFWILWPLLGLGALVGLILGILAFRGSSVVPGTTEEPRDLGLVVAGLVGLASALAWLVAPTSASGPGGMPRGFESGLRYLAPALILGLALFPAAPILRRRVAFLGGRRLSFVAQSATKLNRGSRWGAAAWALAALGALLVAAVGYPVQRHYLKSRYSDPSFATPGLDAAFAWARDISGARIATTSTRQYPLFGTDLSNHVQYLGTERSHGGFEAPATCRSYRRLLNEGHYDYVVTSRDRIEPGKPPYPSTTRWTESPQATLVLKKPPTAVFELHGKLDPAACG